MTRFHEIEPGAFPGKVFFYDYLVIFLIVFLSSSPVISETVRGGGVVVATIWLFFKANGVNKSSAKLLLTSLLLLAPMTLLDIFQTVQSGVVTLSFLFIPAGLILGFFAAQFVDADRLSVVFEKVVFGLALIALLLYGLVVFYPPAISYFRDYTFGGFTHKTAFFLNVLVGEDLIFRNSGFASEPGVFQFYLNMALLLALKRNPALGIRSLVYAFSIVTTNSTAGICIMLILFFLYLNRRWRLLLLLTLPVFGTIVGAFVLQHWEAKVVNDYAADGRLTPAINALKVFIDNPFGLGAYKYTLIYEEAGIGSFDSYTQVALRYGLLGLLALFFLVYRVGCKWGGVAVIYLLSFLTNPFCFSPMVAVFYFSRH